MRAWCNGLLPSSWAACACGTRAARTCAPLHTRWGAPGLSRAAAAACQPRSGRLARAPGAGGRRGGQQHLNSERARCLGSRTAAHEAVQLQLRADECAGRVGAEAARTAATHAGCAVHACSAKCRGPVCVPAPAVCAALGASNAQGPVAAAQAASRRRVSGDRPAPAAALAQLPPPAAAEQLNDDSLTTAPWQCTPLFRPSPCMPAAPEPVAPPSTCASQSAHATAGGRQQRSSARIRGRLAAAAPARAPCPPVSAAGKPRGCAPAAAACPPLARPPPPWLHAQGDGRGEAEM